MLWSLIVRSSVCYGRPVTGTEFRLLLNYANVMIALEVENAQQMEKGKTKIQQRKRSTQAELLHSHLKDENGFRGLTKWFFEAFLFPFSNEWKPSPDGAFGDFLSADGTWTYMHTKNLHKYKWIH